MTVFLYETESVSGERKSIYYRSFKTVFDAIELLKDFETYEVCDSNKQPYFDNNYKFVLSYLDNNTSEYHVLCLYYKENDNKVLNIYNNSVANIVKSNNKNKILVRGYGEYED